MSDDSTTLLRYGPGMAGNDGFIALLKNPRKSVMPRSGIVASRDLL